MIAVTGASGHLGQWVVADLLSRGHDVLCVARRPLAKPTIAGVHWRADVRTLACDLSAPDALAPLRAQLPSLRAVVPLLPKCPLKRRAMPMPTRRNHPHQSVGTARLLALLAEAPRLETIVYASTFEVYGPSCGSPSTSFSRPSHQLLRR